LLYYVIVRSGSDVTVAAVSRMEYFPQAPECRFELQIDYLAEVLSSDCLVTQGKLIS